MRPLVLLVGLAAVGLVVYGAKKNEAKKRAVDAALDLGLDDAEPCEIHEGELEAFASARGYAIFFFEKSDADAKARARGLPSWLQLPPRPEFASNPSARAFSVDTCHFIRWDGTKWVPDDPTHNEFLLWWTRGVA